MQRNSLDAVDPEVAGALDECLGACQAAPDACVATCCEEVAGDAQCN